AISQAVFLLDKQGRCLVPRQPDTFMLPSTLQENVLVSKSGYLFLTLPGLETYTLATKDRPESHDVLLLCAKLIQTFKQEQGITKELGNALKRLLHEELSMQEMDTLMHDYHIAQDTPRAALFINFPKLHQQIPHDTLAEYIPISQTDLLIPLDIRNLVIARDVTDEGQEDVMEYAMALLDTLENELGLHALIGIGQIAPGLEDLPVSYEQAKNAISIGSLFRPETQIYEYSNLILERFIMDCAPEDAKPYIKTVFNRKTAKLFSDEMLETVNVFINRDLNLTDAARDLYIHRNTLVYRLDKIQKVSGLDLRHFKDAMLFRLADGLRKGDTSKTRKGSLQF
ncbi:MAG: hypothetical protein GXZ04_07315, partial [Clostridiales bacterium]|nr:hypothetical protein [Clostridiales bacterium]